MRNRNEENGMEATVIAGTYAALLSIRITSKTVNKKNFLGFEIKRDDLTDKESYPLKGFKYFVATSKGSVKGQLFDTDKQPVQSFFWEDFTAKPEHDYVYHVIPVYGEPKNLEYGKEVSVKITTEKEQGKVHSVFFNRGVAGSLAYAREFQNERPDQMTDEQRQKARVWLSRGLEEALLGFIDDAIENKFGLRIAFYEFTYQPVLEKLQDALDKGCDVQIVYDSRKEKAENDAAIKKAELQRTVKKRGKTINVLTRRTADPQVPSHNKFMIMMDGDNPVSVWTGSTNITDKGVLGQCNVGHRVNDKNIAAKYFDYWQELHTDPAIDDFKGEVANIQDDIEAVGEYSDDITVFFSPRKKKVVLQNYADFISGARQMVCGIFPFSFNEDMKAALAEKTDHLKYILVDKIGNASGIEKKDGYTVIVNGDYFKKAMFDWLQEVNSGVLLNKKPNPVIGTNYVHNKVLLIDPLSAKPVIVTGSANFSNVSVTSNDENTMVIRGGKDLLRISDIYFTEFYRIFHQFVVRKATQEINKGKDSSATGNNNPLHLKTDNSWVAAFNKDGVKTMMQKQLQDMPLSV